MLQGRGRAKSVVRIGNKPGKEASAAQHVEPKNFFDDEDLSKELSIQAKG